MIHKAINSWKEHVFFLQSLCALVWVWHRGWCYYLRWMFYWVHELCPSIWGRTLITVQSSSSVSKRISLDQLPSFKQCVRLPVSVLHYIDCPKNNVSVNQNKQILQVPAASIVLHHPMLNILLPCFIMCLKLTKLTSCDRPHDKIRQKGERNLVNKKHKPR